MPGQYCEVDPIRAWRLLGGRSQRMPMEQAAPLGDFFVTVTGRSGQLLSSISQ